MKSTPKTLLQRLLALAGLLAALHGACAWAAVDGAPETAGWTLSGSARLTFFGFKVYDAKLWLGPGFSRSAPNAGALALELAYLRSFKGQAIAERSIAEMRRQGPLDDAKAQAWQSFMAATFPDVAAGDKLVGIRQAGAPTRFLFNGKEVGRISDAAFDERFFGIWLSAASSQPAMRESLLAKAKP
jgi:hypothetical protein